MNTSKHDGWTPQVQEQEQEHYIKVGDKVFARFPGSTLGLGGVVLMVIQVQGREAEYSVQFSYGGHHVFPASLVTLSS